MLLRLEGEQIDLWDVGIGVGFVLTTVFKSKLPHCHSSWVLSCENNRVFRFLIRI